MEESIRNYDSSLQDIIDMTKKFNSGKITKEQLNEFGQIMSIRAYIPLLEKLTSITSMLFKVMQSNDIPSFGIASMYKDLFFKGLLETYANIDCSDESLQTYENYDLLYPVFGPFIISYCKEDFESYKELLKDAISLSNFREIVDALSSINEEELNRTTAANANMLNSFLDNGDIITKLNNIAVLNDPKFASISDAIKIKAFEQLKLQNNEEVKDKEIDSEE